MHPLVVRKVAQLPSKPRSGSSIPSMCLARHDGQKPRVLQESVNRCSAWESGQWTRAALRSPPEPAADHEDCEARAGIAAIEVALDDFEFGGEGDNKLKNVKITL
jgi:hypothetical protein